MGDGAGGAPSPVRRLVPDRGDAVPPGLSDVAKGTFDVIVLRVGDGPRCLRGLVERGDAVPPEFMRLQGRGRVVVLCDSIAFGLASSVQTVTIAALHRIRLDHCMRSLRGGFPLCTPWFMKRPSHGTHAGRIRGPTVGVAVPAVAAEVGRRMILVLVPGRMRFRHARAVLADDAPSAGPGFDQCVAGREGFVAGPARLARPRMHRARPRARLSDSRARETEMRPPPLRHHSVRIERLAMSMGRGSCSIGANGRDWARRCGDCGRGALLAIARTVSP